MNKEEILNLTMKKIILDNWRAKLGYLLNYKSLEELEAIIDYYEGYQNNLEKELDQQEQIIREAKELCRERIDFINAEYDDSFECCVEELGNVLEILDRNVK